MTKQSLQWTSLLAALAVAIGSQASLLGSVISAAAVVWVLAACNILSAVLPSITKAQSGPSTNRGFQWVVVGLAASTALADQLPILKEVISPQVAIWILMGTNILSAVLPSITGAQPDTGTTGIAGIK